MQRRKRKPIKMWKVVNGKIQLNRRIVKMVDDVKVEKTAENAGVSIAVNKDIYSHKDVVVLAEKFRKHFSEVEDHFWERKGELEQIKYAMLIREHVLLKGKTGTAKSKLGKYSFGYIKGGRTFAIQMSKFMSEEYLFGAIDINKMRNEGKMEHRTEDSITDCEFAFIDEVFDANDATLRSLLEVLNERTFTRHTQRVECRLHSAVLTSNFVREDEATEAFLDRILFKSDVKYLAAQKNRMSMYKHYVKHGDKGHLHLSARLANKGISFDELQVMSEFILGDNIEIPDMVLKVYDMVLKEFCKQSNLPISDRKANKMLNVLKASALMKGRNKVEFDDVESIKFALVVLNNEQQEELFKAVFAKLMSENVRIQQVTVEMDDLWKVYDILKSTYNKKMKPKSTEILELNDEAHLFEEKLIGHNFNNGTGFPEMDNKFAEMRQGTDKVIREIAKSLKLSNK